MLAGAQILLVGLVNKARHGWNRLKCALVAAPTAAPVPTAAPALPPRQTRATSSGTNVGQPPEPHCHAVHGENSSPEGREVVFAILGDV